MLKDGRLVEHTREEEKVLGYKYNVQKASLIIGQCNNSPQANIKRKVLSQTSKLYEPLNFALPITTRGKLLLRIWKLEVGWNEPLPEEICMK